MELILDASSQSGTVGLAHAGRLLWASEPLSPQDHTREFLPAILRGLESVSATFGLLRFIVVALGPGPFNGLRVAMATAKGVSVGTGAVIAGVPTLEAEIARCAPANHPIRPVVAAGRSNFTTATFRHCANQWMQIDDTRHMSATDIAAETNPGTVICGDTGEFLSVLRTSDVPVKPSCATHLTSRLESLAVLGWHRCLTGMTTEAAALQPLYVHPPRITTPRERRI